MSIKGNYQAILELANKQQPGARRKLRELIKKNPLNKRIILDTVLVTLQATSLQSIYAKTKAKGIR